MKTIANTLLHGALACALACSLAGLVSNAAAASKKILVITESKGFTHSVVKRGEDGLCLVEKTLAKIGSSSGVFETVNSQNAIEALTRDNVAKYDAIFFYTTGTLLPAGEPREALLEFVKSGKGFIGAHSATDTFADFKGYYQLINGTFDGHPWGAGTTSTFVNHEPSHPIVKMFPESFRYKDEIYQYKNYTPESVRVLISLDMSGSQPQMPYHVPVCWVREYGKGRLFYTNLGHNESTWNDARYQGHLLTGIRWALGLEEAPAAPNPDVQALEHAKSFLVVGAPLLDQDWKDLLAKAAAKGRANPGFYQTLRAQIDSFKSLPQPDPKKDTPDKVQAAQAKRKAEAAKIVKLIDG